MTTDADRDAEMRRWNRALESGDRALIDATRNAILDRIAGDELADWNPQGRTR